jgi:hypothetical protein
MLFGEEGAFTFPARDVRLFETVRDVWNNYSFIFNCVLIEIY